MNYKIRQATRKELDLMVKWAEKEGWNPGIHDADVFWKTDPKGYFILEKDGKMIGSVSGVTYNRKFGFGGFFIIKPEFRNKKLGTDLANYLFKKTKEKLDKEAAIGIDGVFAMQPTYSKWGFKFSHRNPRMEGLGQKLIYSDNVKETNPKDFQKIHKVDEECFGFDRTNFLKDWLKLPQSKAFKYEEGKQIRGYGVIRKCKVGYKIGPLFAQNYKIAHELFKAMSNFAKGKAIFLDTPEINKDAIKLAKKYKMKEMFGCARMYTGKAPKLPYDKIFGVTTFELGQQ